MTKKEIRAEITKLRKKLKTKPRGKAKGGQYERDVATMIVAAFADRGISKDDCFRTPRGSKEGDLKCGSALAKMFPFTIEVKFYASVPYYHMLHKFEKMQDSWPWKKWWLQLEEEVKLTKKPGILVFRENRGVDLVSIYASDVAKWPKLQHTPRFTTYKEGFEIWTFSLSRFLKVLKRSF
jgi:hypothetical protein